MKTLGIGVIEMGWMGMVHSRAYRQVGERFADAQIRLRLIICADEVEARAIYGPKCEMSFEVNGTGGAVKWNFERMNELELYLPDEAGEHAGYTRLLDGPRYPFHGRFNPSDGIGIGYEDLKTIEAYQFLQLIETVNNFKP